MSYIGKGYKSECMCKWLNKEGTQSKQKTSKHQAKNSWSVCTFYYHIKIVCDRSRLMMSVLPLYYTLYYVRIKVWTRGQQLKLMQLGISS